MTKIIPTLKEINNWSYPQNELRQNPLHLTNYALYGLRNYL